MTHSSEFVNFKANVICHAEPGRSMDIWYFVPIEDLRVTFLLKGSR